MNHRDANLAVLRRFHPEVARRIESLPPVSETGLWTISRAGSATVRREGLALASLYDPLSEASRALPSWDEAVDFAVLPGLGAGYLVEALAARYPDLPVVVVESDPAWFAEVLAHRDLSSLWSNPRIVPLLGPDPRIIGDFFGPLACRRVEILEWRPLAATAPGWNRAVADQVALAQAQARVNLATYKRFGGLWRRNLEKNEARVTGCRPLTELTGWGKGFPAVIAAAGPSLAERFDWLASHRSRFLLVAVDTAWPALAAHGIEPDILLVLDGQYWNARHVDLLPPDRTLVVTEWIGPPRAFRLAPDRTFVAATSVSFLRTREEGFWGSLGALPTGGSVATAAWSLALRLGCSQVAFAGLDLGYPRGQTHVPGSQFEEMNHRKAYRLCPAETLGLGLRGFEGLSWRPADDGGQILSDPRMDLFRDWISRAVAAHPEIPAINLGTRGSSISGLVPAPPGYGDDWPEVRLGSLPLMPALFRHSGNSGLPPFSVLEGVGKSSDFSSAVEDAWAAAEGYWGRDVWEPWGGRAKRTWDRWPSPRSKKAVEEVLALSKDWEGFWKTG